jgi:hypothetical protein
MLVAWRDERWASAQRRQTDAVKCHSDNHAMDSHDANTTI